MYVHFFNQINMVNKRDFYVVKSFKSLRLVRERLYCSKVGGWGIGGGGLF